MKRFLLFLLVPLLLVGCAGNKINTVITLQPIIATEIQSVQQAVESQKDGLVAVSCGAQNCYLALQADILKIATYQQALDAALRALDTPSAKTAILNMDGVVSGWITSGILQLPATVRPFVLVALEALRAGLLTAQTSLGA